MARSQNSFIKKLKAEKKKKKQAEKLQKRIEKKNQETSGSLEDMIAYVDEYGNIQSGEPDEVPKDTKNINQLNKNNNSKNEERNS